MFNDADENAFIREKRDLNQISEIRLIVKDVYSHNNHSKMQWYSTYEFMSKVMKKMKALLTSTIIVQYVWKQYTKRYILRVH